MGEKGKVATRLLRFADGARTPLVHRPGDAGDAVADAARQAHLLRRAACARRAGENDRRTDQLAANGEDTDFLPPEAPRLVHLTHLEALAVEPQPGRTRQMRSQEDDAAEREDRKSTRLNSS